MMERQRIPNKEEIKERIETERVDIKFYQTFFLPLISGLVVYYFTNEPFGDKLVLIVFGFTVIIFLYWRRLHIKKKINGLIDKLKE